MLANPYQVAVLDFVRAGSGHGVVEATAGSGKTTTLLMVARLLVDEVLSPGERACFLAFNRSTAAELRARLPGAVEAATLHSLGRTMLADSRTGRLQLEPGKYQRLARALLARTNTLSVVGQPPTLGPPPPSPQLGEVASYLAELHDFARLELSELVDAANAAGIRARYGLRPPLPARELRLVEELLPALAAAGDDASSIDFTDMICLPQRLDLPAPEYTFICVDEAQDLSRAALGLVARLLRAGARALFVGDPYQAIYAFAGADARSLARITTLTSATRLPLSVSFRCPVRHVSLARRFAPPMLAAGNAIAGSVTITTVERLPRFARTGDLIMARTNAPLPEVAFQLAAQGTPTRILGHDLVAHATELAHELFTAGKLADAERRVTDSADAQRRRLEFELLTSDDLPAELEHSRHAHLALRLALKALLARPGPRTRDDLEHELERLFAAEGAHVMLSTIHKAKGREAATTFLLFPEGLGIGHAPAHDLAGDDAASAANDADLAEANVLFVALTRAKRELVLVESEPGAVAARLERGDVGLTTGPTADLTRRWNDVLRLALIMSRATDAAGISSSHGKARRVQDSWRQAGGGRRHPGRRRDKQRRDNR